MTTQQIITKHAEVIDTIKSQLATNFDVPAQRIINAGFDTMGIDRFDASGDVWEQIVCLQNGWDYERPSNELQERWASY
jgi:hypothetical protein